VPIASATRAEIVGQPLVPRSRTSVEATGTREIKAVGKAFESRLIGTVG